MVIDLSKREEYWISLAMRGPDLYTSESDVLCDVFTNRIRAMVSARGNLRKGTTGSLAMLSDVYVCASSPLHNYLEAIKLALWAILHHPEMEHHKEEILVLYDAVTQLIDDGHVCTETIERLIRVSEEIRR